VAFRVLRAVQQAEALAKQKLQTTPAAAAEPAAAGKVTVCDINPEMLKEGMKRAGTQAIPGKGSLGHQHVVFLADRDVLVPAVLSLWAAAATDLLSGRKLQHAPCFDETADRTNQGAPLQHQDNQAIFGVG
jgi:hypothetical protein